MYGRGNWGRRRPVGADKVAPLVSEREGKEKGERGRGLLLGCCRGRRWAASGLARAGLAGGPSLFFCSFSFSDFFYGF